MCETYKKYSTMLKFHQDLGFKDADIHITLEIAYGVFYEDDDVYYIQDDKNEVIGLIKNLLDKSITVLEI